MAKKSAAESDVKSTVAATIAESSAPLVDVVTKLLKELGVLSDDVLERIGMILEHERIPEAAADRIRQEAERLIGAQGRLRIIEAAAAGLIDLARTGKSVASHSDADLA